MPKMNGGEALVQSLVKEGVEVVFGIPGIHMSGIIVALRDEPSIRMITTRHEAGATHMADGYSRASGKPGVALVVPGAGQIPRGAIGKNLGAIHEVFDQAGVMSPVTKWRRQVLRPREIPSAVNEAFRQMRTGRPRPVLLDIPPETSVEREEVQLRDPAPLSRIVPSSEDLREAARIIAQASLPLIFAGGGANPARSRRWSNWLKQQTYLWSRPAAARERSRTAIRCATGRASVPQVRYTR